MDQLSTATSILPQAGRDVPQAAALSASERLSEISEIASRSFSTVVERLTKVEVPEGVPRIKRVANGQKLSETVRHGVEAVLPTVEETRRSVGERLLGLSRGAAERVNEVSGSLENAFKRIPDVQAGASASISQVCTHRFYRVLRISLWWRKEVQRRWKTVVGVISPLRDCSVEV